MGLDATVQTDPTTWALPSGREMASGHYIRALLAGGGNDTWQAQRIGGAGAFVEIARYRIPVEHMGTGFTGADSEYLMCTGYVKASGGVTGTLRLETPQTTGDKTFVGAVLTWEQKA